MQPNIGRVLIEDRDTEARDVALLHSAIYEFIIILIINT